MTSARRLRKTLLSMLEDKILPELHSGQSPCIVTAQLPLRVPPNINVRAMPHPPLCESDANRIYPEGKMWPDVQLHAARFPAQFCVLEGEADLLMGVTTNMLRALPSQSRNECPGGYIFSLPAPSYFLVPPGVPQKTGALVPWQRRETHTGKLRFFHIRVLPVGALCNYSTMTNGVYEVEYSLLVKEPQLSAIMGILLEELSTVSADSHIVHAQLLTLMLRLERNIRTQPPAMTDGLYSRFPESEPHALQEHLLHDPIIQQAHEFIRLRLHEPLTPTLIARQVQHTPSQLNRLFKTTTGLSPMKYVEHLRMESAQLLLANSDLSVQEISQLVGFRQLPYFSRRFHRHTGNTPLKFRQQKKSSP
jgi:AraC-like DNA-binding protein